MTVIPITSAQRRLSLEDLAVIYSLGEGVSVRKIASSMSVPERYVQQLSDYRERDLVSTRIDERD
jgi:hypothetical protein